MPLTLEIVTPEARVYSDTIDNVVIPTVEGEIGILPGHLPLLSQVLDGELRVTKGTNVEALIVGDGFVQVQGDKVSVLAEHAIEESAIDQDAVEKACARAQLALEEAKNSKIDPAEIERLESVVRFSVAQLFAKKRKR
ncbi:ATP synthase F1 subunit epsilon [Synoicihabitans lomoniglobus]|uniref:ATP synthase epsilon chain n=1 Tax=Synoicihabitans lomoniglobus TaxID=2909285 RepID=A0AAF0A0V8_9BACT|nr:ATP synthase F1 subunit epsilon [Opitutaceae bacterium LMO-M01]WED64522.1 ATP synthase F1 subunit epsilon [Opitutaceae bacterium LMO-M01]